MERLPFEMPNFLRIASLGLASHLSEFGILMWKLDVNALKEHGYTLEQSKDYIAVYDQRGLCVGETHHSSDFIYLISVQDKALKFDAEHDRWLNS